MNLRNHGCDVGPTYSEVFFYTLVENCGWHSNDRFTDCSRWKLVVQLLASTVFGSSLPTMQPRNNTQAHESSFMNGGK